MKHGEVSTIEYLTSCHFYSQLTANKVLSAFIYHRGLPSRLIQALGLHISECKVCVVAFFLVGTFVNTVFCCILNAVDPGTGWVCSLFISVVV